MLRSFRRTKSKSAGGRNLAGQRALAALRHSPVIGMWARIAAGAREGKVDLARRST